MAGGQVHSRAKVQWRAAAGAEQAAALRGECEIVHVCELEEIQECRNLLN
jgi:hypothetical protein